MNKTTKLNGPIRALFKSKAKEKLEELAKVKVDPAKKEINETLAQIAAIKDVAALVREHNMHVAKARNAGAKLYGMGIQPNEDGSVSLRYSVEKGSRFYSSFVRKQELERGIKEASSCQCKNGDSPELLEFAANLSLCKTVGEAQALLEKIK